jgi:hypothetical protein
LNLNQNLLNYGGLMNFLDKYSQDILDSLNYYSDIFIIPEDYVIIFNSADIAFIWKTIEQNLEVDHSQSHLIVKNLKDKIYYLINDDIYNASIKFLIQLGLIEQQGNDTFKVNFDKFIKIVAHYLTTNYRLEVEDDDF